MQGEVIVKQARTWLGTKFHHQGRAKKKQNDCGGVDCIGLVIGVAAELNLKSHLTDKAGRVLNLAEFDIKGYSRDPQGQKLKDCLDSFLVPIDESEMRVGDILLFTLLHDPQHIGIVGFIPEIGLTMLHAYQTTGKVCEHGLCKKWKKRISSVYRFRDGAF